MKLDYSERCLLKIEALLGEIIDDLELGHIYKTIAALWEIIELTIRAFIYRKIRNTYEKPKKLIHELKKILKTEHIHLSEAKIIFQYEMRKRAVHRPAILTKKDLKLAKNNFCATINPLIELLEKTNMNTNKIRELTEKLCKINVEEH